MRGKVKGKPEAYRAAINADIGIRLRRLRRARGMSYREVAEGVGVTFQMIQKYENGKCDIPISRFFRICEVLDVPYKVVLYEFTPPKSIK